MDFADHVSVIYAMIVKWDKWREGNNHSFVLMA
jgi:hypothetical protein